MARYASAVLVAVLLAATALAFVYTESLKLTPSPILGTRVLPKAISPVCDCETGAAVIAFRLREGDALDIEMIDARGEVVRRLVWGQRRPRGPVTFVWNGRNDSRSVVPEGVYRPRVRLRQQHRTIVLPNPVRVDTTPPKVAMTRLAPRVFSPDGDSRSDRVVVGYRVDEPARVSLYVGGSRAVLKKGSRTEGTIDWFGLESGMSLPRGPYALHLGAVDIAGNEGLPTRSKIVVIRTVALGHTSIETVPGARFAVLVLTDAARVTWRLGGRSGGATPGTLRLRAPLQPGRFTLTVTANGNSARAAVLVRSAAP
ncbi:MAG: FlgD immunoglobulin-like domain containing protein [Thermoleophilia bacterium]